MQVKSLNSVKIISIDEKQILDKLKSSAKRLIEKDKNVVGVYLFGSLAKKEAVPGSDADILIILKESKKRIIDRIPDFVDFFSDIGIGVEIFPYTEKELEKFKKEKNLFIERIFKEMIKLA